MQNFKAKLLLFLLSYLILSPLLSPLSSLAAYDQLAAQTYLFAHANNPWATMGLAALGAPNIPTDYLKNISSSSAVDYEAPILALTATNNDPHTFGSFDYVAKLENFHQQNQLGDPTLVNDDIFGILALLSAGVGAGDPIVSDSKNFILTHQNTDGGWSYSTSASSDSNTTAAAIVALAAAGLSSSDTHLTSALNYLKTAQNDDGGFTYDPHSSYGTTSDTSSTVWAVWALNSLNIQPTTWSKGTNTPISYLESNQAASGYFKYQPNSSEDSFSLITTAYAVIALAGKTLPLNSPSLSSEALAKEDEEGIKGEGAVAVPFRIEGSANTICTGTVAAITALDVIKNASAQCDFTYHIKDTSFGPYLDQINNDSASGNIGWLYDVNNTAPSVGAADFQLQTGDEVLWYFGDFSWLPTRLTLQDSAIASNQTTTAKVEAYANGAWTALAGATVNIGATTATTDADGIAAISAADGYFKIFAQKNGYVRSNTVLLQVGQPGSSNVSLSVNIPSGQVKGTTTAASVISFSVSPSALDFGTLAPGKSGSKTLTLTNGGTGAILVQSQVSGANVFKNGLVLNNSFWQNFQQSLAAGQNQQVSAKLTIPDSIINSGEQSGQIIFWAEEAN